MSNTNPRPLGEKVPNTNPAPRPSKNITLSGKHVTLSPISADHAPALFPLIGGPENAHLWDYMPYDSYPTSVTALHDSLVRKATSTDPTFYTIFKHDGDTKKAVGWCSYLRIEPKNRVIEVGHLMFSSALQRSAASTEAMYLMAKYAFEDLGYRRYEWKCHSLNGPSRRAALRLGFVEEGTFRQHLIDKFGRNRDTTWFSMLDGEWEDRKKAFEGWLDEGNFDEQGRQKRKLEEFRG